MEIAYAVIPTIPSLSEPLRTQAQAAFAQSLHPLWYTMAGISGFGALTVLLMKEVPMHEVTDEDWGMTGEGNMSDDSEDEEDEIAVDESMDQDDAPQSSRDSGSLAHSLRGSSAWARSNPNTSAFSRAQAAQDETPTRPRTSRRR